MGADIKKGDRVRVVIEGEVTSAADGGGFHFDVGQAAGWIHPDAPEVVSVEKIEPPVEVFGPGDVVRSISQPDYVYLVRPNNRYIYLRTHHDHHDHDAPNVLVGREFGPASFGFTSKYYERVDLS